MTTTAEKSTTPRTRAAHPEPPGQAAKSEAHPKPLTLPAALVAFQAAMPKVHKGQTARIPGRDGKSGYSYTYADLGDVTAVAMPLLTAQGLAFSSCPRRSETGAYELVGILLHESGETLEGSLPLNGRDPQQLGSALTYMRRYLLASITGIVADDDDDAQAGMQDTQQTRQDPPPPPPPVTPLPRTDDPDALAATASILSDLSDIADRQEPSRDLAWITTKLRREAGGVPVEDLYTVDPAPLEALLHRWQNQDQS